MNALSRNQQSTSTNLNKRLLLTAATSALLCFSTSANAACTINGTLDTVVCTTGAGTFAAVGAVDLTPAAGLTFTLNSGAAISDGVTVGPGNNQFSLSAADNTTTVAGTISVQPGHTGVVVGNTATIANGGILHDLTLGFFGSGFGDKIAITNSAGGSIAALEAYSAVSNTLTNSSGGTIGSVLLDTLNPASVTVVSPHDHPLTGFVTTDVTETTWANAGGKATFTNGGAVTGGITMYGTDLSLSNTGTVGGAANLDATNSWGRNSDTKTTAVYLDADMNWIADDANTNGFADNLLVTTVTEYTPWGGGVTVMNQGTLAAISAEALNSSAIANLNKITGNVIVDGAGAIHEISTVSNHTTDTGDLITVTATTHDVQTPVGNTLNVLNDTAGEIGGLLSARSLTSSAVVNNGLIKGAVTVNSSAVSTVFDHVVTTTTVDTPAVAWAPSTTTVAGPPQIDTTVWKGSANTGSGSSESQTTVTTSVGGAASLTNSASGTIGVSASPVAVLVVGDTSADATNAGAIFGSVDVESTPNVATAKPVAHNFSDQIINTWAATETTIHNVTDAYYPSDVYSYASSNGDSHTSDNASAVNYGAGEASLTTAAGSSISSFVKVFSTGAASADNAGTILGNVSIGDGGLIDTSSDTAHAASTLDAYTHTFNHAETLVGAAVWYDYLDNYLDDKTHTSSDVITTSSGTNSSTASLINETGAVIGVKATPAQAVTVFGEKSATATNAGTIYGSLAVQAVDYTRSEVNSTLVDQEQIRNTSDEVLGIVGPGTYEEKYTDAATKGGNTYDKSWTTTSDVLTITPTASTASVTNSGSISLFASVLGSAASLDNAGTILGAVSVTTQGSSLDKVSTTTSNKIGHEYTSTSTHDVIFNAPSGADATSADTYTSDLKKNDVTATYSTLTVTTPTGTDASLINEAAGTIGKSGGSVAVNVMANGVASLSNAGKIYGITATGWSANSVQGYDWVTTTGSTSNNAVVKDVAVTGSTVTDTTLSLPLSVKSDAVTTVDNNVSATSLNKHVSGGGSATLTTVAKSTMAGDWLVFGHTGASADNAGTISGSLDVDAGRFEWNATSATSDHVVSKDELVTNNTFSYPAPDALKTLEAHDKYSWTEDAVLINASSLQTLLGGDALITNETGGSLGASGTATLVYGVTSSTLANNGTITGNAYVGTAVTGSAQSIWSAVNLVSTVTTSKDTKSTTGTSSYDNLDTYKNAVALTKSEKSANDWSSDEAITVNNDVTAVGGKATYTGTGALYGSLYVASVGDATITNSSTIGAKAGGGTVSVQSVGVNTVGSSGTPDLVETIHRDHHADASDISTDLTTTESKLANSHDYTKDTIDTVYSTTNTGGAALLTNTATGVIGGDSNVPINVLVVGTKSATLNNLGHISGNATVQAVATDEKVTKHEVKTDDITVANDSEFTYATKAPFTTEVVNNVSHEVVTDNYTKTWADTAVGGAAVATNTSSWTITGNLIVNGTTSATVTNSGQIWGNVTATTTPAQKYAETYTVGSTVTIDITKVGTTPNFVTTTTTVTANTSDDKYGWTSVGGDSLVTNTGSIGLRVDNTSGGTTVTGGNVTLYADGNASVSNALGAIIYGTVNASATGNTDNREAIDAYNNKDVKVVTVKTGVTTDTQVGTDKYSYVRTQTHTGGTALVTNNGIIGQAFAATTSAGGGLTARGDVNLYGDKAATLINTNLIGGGADIESDVSNYADNYVSNNDWNTSLSTAAAGARTTNSSSTNTENWTAAGGVASITNSGKIGPDVYNGYVAYPGVTSSIYVLGDAGASITNSTAGLIQADNIDVISTDVANRKQVTTDSIKETDTGTTGLSPTWTIKSKTETYSQTNTYTPVGGKATLTNAGAIKAQAYSLLDISVDGFAGATITNSGTIETTGYGTSGLGSVVARSWDYSEVASDTWTKVQTTAGVLVSSTETTTDKTTAAGGTALVDNTGTIKADVYSEGFTLGKVLNEAGAKITGDVEADSFGWNRDFAATVNLVGPTGSPAAGDVYHEYITLTGNNALVDNSGAIGGSAGSDAAVNATTINRAGATIGGQIWADSLFQNTINDGPTAGTMGTGGVVTSPYTGGTSVVNNYGSVVEGFSVVSFKGSTLTNDARAVLDSDGSYGGYMYTYDTAATSFNSFTNAGTIGYAPATYSSLAALLTGVTGVTLLGGDVIEFRGNTGSAFVDSTHLGAAANTGIINENLLFTDSLGVAAGSHSTAFFTFASGSIVTGNINAPGDLTDGNGSTLANLTLTFDGTGLYQGNIYGATTTNKTGAGTWIFTGSALGVGNATISAGLVEIGTPLNYFAAQPTSAVSALLTALGLSSSWDPLQGTNPYAGNTAISSNLQGQTVSSSLIYQLSSAPLVKGNITIASGAGLEGRAIIAGNVTNAGTLLAGWQLAASTAPLSNLLDNTNQVLPSAIEITGNYTQTGTLITNLAPSVNRPTRLLVGTQAGLFAPTSYWLSVAPFTADATPSSFVKVDGNATVGGTVKVYVNKGGLYVAGQTAAVLASTGTLISTATATQSAPSLFVSFGLTTSGNTLSVVTNRTSYASVATNAIQTNIGKALDSAVKPVSDAIKANTFASVADFTAAQDMAGFLADMDWQVTSSSQAASIIGSLSPDAYASLAAIDTGAGFKNQLTYRLTRLPGAAASDVATGAWIKAYGVSQNIDANSGAGKLSGTTVGTSLGWDVAIDNFVVGIAAGYSRTTIDTAAKSFDGAINAYQVGAYAEGTWNALYVNATLWADFGNGHVNRALTSIDRVATASVKPSEFRADIEGGWRFTYNTTGITPYLNLSVRDAKLDNVSETGAGGLGYKLSNIGSTLFTPTLGVRFDDKWSVSNFVSVEPLVGLGIAFQPKLDDITAQFVGGGSAFQVNGAVDSNVAFTPDVGLNILLGRSVSLQLAYSGAISSNRSSHGGWIGLRGNW